jgi:hypothetical protein
MKSIQTTSSESDSVELALNAKQEYTWVIKVYGDNMASMVTKIEDTNKELKTKFGKKEL